MTAIEPETIALSSGPVRYFARGDGRPVLYLHPAGGLRWTPVIERLVESFTVYLPIAPGFDGTAPHESVRSVPALADLAAEFVQTVIGAPCDVIGHSLGGWQALWLAAHHPELVDHIVVEAPDGLSAAQPEGFPRNLEALRKLLFAHPERAEPNPKPSETIAANAAAAVRYAPPGHIDTALLADLPAVETLTLILQGTEDRVCPTESVQRLRRLMRNSFLVYVWDAAHSPEVDQPDRTFSIIESFLTRSESFMVNWGTLAVSRG